MKSDIEKYIEKVLESSEFKGSQKYQKLFEYLVRSSIDGNVPKEITIAYDVFNIEFEHASSGESNVRVYVYNLRKKLELYYADEGKEDKIQFEIAKGAYKVEFIEKSQISKKPPLKWIIVFSVITVLIALNIYFVFLHYIKPVENKNLSGYIWSDISKNDLPVLVVIGDYFIVKESIYPNRYRYSRDSRINSEFDFNQFLEQYPQNKDVYYKTSHTFTGKFAPVCMNEMNKLLLNFNKPVEVILSSDFQWHDLQNYNVIYIGSFKSLGLMKNLLTNSNFEYIVYPNELIYHQLEPDSVFHYNAVDSDKDNALESDYAVVTKVPATNKTNIIFFLSTRDIGLIAMAKYFTNPEQIKEFENDYLKSDSSTSYFETCFKILGLQRTTRSVEMLHVNKNLNFPITN
jgi:hypothetical protein